MAAGLGFKDFTTGEVLTAADVDGYLMQGIWVFANAAARDAAVTSPQEGNACYLKDTDVIQVYTGSAWAAQSASNPISANIVDAKGDLIVGTAADTVARLASSASNGNVLTVDTSTASGLKWAAPAGGGKVLQVIQDTLTSDYTTTSSSYSDTGLTVSITPSSASSKVLIIVAGSAYNYAPSGGNTAGLSYFQLVRDSTALQNTNVGRYNMSATYNGGIYGTVGLCHLDSPATTSATTYKVQGLNNDSASTTLSGSATNMASIIVMEIGA